MDKSSRDDSAPAYRVASRSNKGQEWFVAYLEPGEPESVLAPGFATEAEAQVEADRLNAADAARRDETLRRMLGTPRVVKPMPKQSQDNP
jgi:hypothetical protein